MAMLSSSHMITSMLPSSHISNDNGDVITEPDHTSVVAIWLDVNIDIIIWLSDNFYFIF
jgi:hypothetical protein